MQRKVNVVEDLDGNKIVVIHDVKFKGKRSLEWEEVETYLKQFVGESYVIEDTNDMIYIGTDFPDEYAHSEYTMSLKGANTKAKANAAQGIPELIEIATSKEYRENVKDKHSKDAKFGWYRYDSRFALPVYKENGEIAGYNFYKVIMVIRHARLRRNISAEDVARKAGISKFTLTSIEKGATTVSIGAYAAVLAVLNLDEDFGLIAVDELGKKRYWDQNLQKRERASRKK